MKYLRSWRSRAGLIRRDTYALYLACRDPRTPRLAKILTGLVVAYALSPIDLIPDFIPLLGAVDDLIIVPAGIALAVRMIPADVMTDSRARADVVARRAGRVMGIVVVVIWILVVALVAYILAKVLGLRP